MPILMVGVHEKLLDLSNFERYSVPSDRLPKLVTDIYLRDSVSEATVLSTCNRLEVYARAERFHVALEDIADAVAVATDQSLEAIRGELMVKWDDSALAHLFRVASGMESAVVGEHEIQGQVRGALELARAEGSLGSALDNAFRRALEAGKRVRTETTIGSHTASVSAAAIELAKADLGTISGRNCLVIGSGQMGSRLATLAVGLGAQVAIASRTLKNAQQLADKVGAEAFDMAEMPTLLAWADCLLAGAAVADPIVGAAELAHAGQLTVVDVGVPRNVDVEAAEVDAGSALVAKAELGGAVVAKVDGVSAGGNVTVFDMTAVRSFVEGGIAARAAELAAAETIVEEELARYRSDRNARAAVPTIAALRDQLESLRSAELAKRVGSETSPEVATALNEFSRALIARIAHEPTMLLRKTGGTLQGERIADAVRDLFNID